jgi:hypothetical protein
MSAKPAESENSDHHAHLAYTPSARLSNSAEWACRGPLSLLALSLNRPGTGTSGGADYADDYPDKAGLYFDMSPAHVSG